MGSFRKSLGIAAVIGIAAASTARAQDDARARLLIPDVAGLSTQVGHFPRGAPGSSTGAPIAFGANWGDVYVGAGLQTPARFSGTQDGALVAGMGFFDASDVVGLDMSLTSFSTIHSGLFHRMGLGLKAHKLLDDNWGIALGIDDIYLSNQPANTHASVYGVVSKVMGLDGTWLSDFESVTFSAGLGNEGFRLEPDIRDNHNTIGAFGSVALRMFDQLSLIMDWPGQDLDIGVSVVPFADFPLVITPGVADITGSAGTFATAYSVRSRFTLGVGMAFRF
jgi:hypothetical protein